MSSAKREKKPNLFSRLTSRILGTDHLPAPGQVCEVCGGDQHSWCAETDGPDLEHIAVELANIERRRAA